MYLILDSVVISYNTTYHNININIRRMQKISSEISMNVNPCT